jgi:phage antirepressor YoqD-like protein
MTEVSTLAPSVSPFDAIKFEDELGEEYWSARDLLMSHTFNYSRWSDAHKAVLRARASIANTLGEAAAQEHMRDLPQKVSIGSGAEREIQDYRLTRYGAYLVVMNGDPKKPEIAKAQSYFAARTREAELAQATPQYEIPADYAAALELAAAQHRELTAAAEKIGELEPKAAQADLYLDAENLINLRSFARDMQQWYESLGKRITQQLVYDYLNEIGLIIRRPGGLEHNQATAYAIKSDYARNYTHLIKRSDMSVETVKVARLTPSGQAYAWSKFYDLVGTRYARDLPKPPAK